MSDNIFERTSIIQHAKDKWNAKTDVQKRRSAKKYKFISNYGVNKPSGWLKTYDELNNWQKNILIKGQLIRNYDELPNKVKTHIMKDFGLSTFASKWYKLPSSDKKILLNSVLRNNE